MKHLAKIGKADLHIHSNFSDGKMSIGRILRYVERKTDLDIIAITDHNTIEGALLAQKIVREKNFCFKVIVGEEIDTRDGHILALFIKKMIPAGLSAAETIKLIKAQNGLVIAPHPFFKTKFKGKNKAVMNGIGLDLLEQLKSRLDAVETNNASLIFGKYNLEAQFFNRLFGKKPEVGGSDAHILQGIGKGYTKFAGKNPDDLRCALSRGKTSIGGENWELALLLKYLFLFLPDLMRIFCFTIRHRLFGRPRLKRLDQQVILPKSQTGRLSCDTPKISVVIPAYNEEKYISSCLKSLQKQTFKEFEVIVVDNGSADATAKIAGAYGARVIEEKQKGVCFARGRGALEARGEIIVSTDADCKFGPNWLANIYRSFCVNSGLVAALGPFQYQPRPRWGRAYSNLLFGIVEHFYFKKGRVVYAAASNFAFKKSAFEQAGGYNTALTQGGDEHDLLKRLRKFGGELYLSENGVTTSSRRLKKGFAYSFFVTFLGFYIFDYYVAAKIFGRSIFGAWPDFRESIKPKWQVYLKGATYGLLILFFSLSFIFGTGKVYAKGRVVTGGKRVISVTKGATKDAFSDISKKPKALKKKIDHHV